MIRGNVMQVTVACVLRNRWRKVYWKCAVCQGWHVCVCAGNQSVLDLCLFLKINIRALDTPSTVVPRLCCFQSTSGDSSASGVLSGPAFIHWMSHSFHSIITTPRSHLLCSDTVAKGDNVWPLPVLRFYLSAIGSITSPIGSDNLLICKDSVEPSCPDAFSSLLPCN